MDWKDFFLSIGSFISDSAIVALVFMLLWKWHAELILPDAGALTFWESLGVVTLISFVTHQLPSSEAMQKTRSQEQAHRRYLVLMRVMTALCALIIGGLADVLS